ncbi:hypothetical protein LS482_08515 [Sinomicrobium kalidii]|uniref:hypothetical protein n=1 Tax=Sinomicrobium kalidii TaxID=2900738 RepID=UPI001E2D301B|nr:hypothetical protein [Sinomicrobium kalidii]UGU17909.1 hypothetical protein LS482_08515 [Sinomicrobium kalidii]
MKEIFTKSIQRKYVPSPRGRARLGILSLMLPFAFYAQTNTFPASGKVGIGTTSPEAKLEVHNTGTIGAKWNPANSYLTIKDNNNALIIDPNELYSSQTMRIGTANGDIKFGSVNETGAVDKMVIKGDGNVGVGTLAPVAKLEVKGQGTLASSWEPAKSYFTITDGNSSLIADSNEIYSSGTLHVGSAGGDVVKFRMIGDNGPEEKMIIKGNGNVGIGTTVPDAKLAVNGVVHSKEVKVDLNGWSDFVFKEGYHLPTLTEVEQHIKEKGHLKDIPNTKEVKENGIHLGEMNAKLLQKIEELMLYTIEQEKRIKKLETELANLKQSEK